MDFFLHDAGVVLQVGQAGDIVNQGRDKGSAANGFQLVAIANGLGQGQEVNGLGALQQRNHVPENGPVATQIEVLRAQELDRLVDELAIQQDGSQNATLRLDILGKFFFQRGVGRHGSGSERNGGSLPGGTSPARTPWGPAPGREEIPYSSRSTSTITTAVTSWWSLMGTSCLPRDFRCSSRSIFRRSISKPFSFSDSAISREVTEP